jgi:hypothetical protein
MSSSQLKQLIKKCLDEFYRKRLDSPETLDLKAVLKRKNPYLFRATGVNNAPDMIGQLLEAHVSSSDETIFGNVFFEPICQAVTEAPIAAARGADFARERDDVYEVIALKSGPNIFNASQATKQGQEFDEIQASLRATLRSMRKQFVPIMGCGYGRVNSEPTSKRRFYKLAGQAFWEKVTGDEDFYLKISRLMNEEPARHRPIFREAWGRAVNRFVREFTIEFCDEAGNVQWEKLTAFNSGRPPATKAKPAKKTATG